MKIRHIDDSDEDISDIDSVEQGLNTEENSTYKKLWIQYRKG
jgi:hypothetical protein